VLIKPTAVAEFDGQSLDIYDISGVRWIRGVQICTILGISDRTLKRAVKEHRKEFGPEMTGIVVVPTAGGAQQARVFSPRGAALLAMLVNAPNAADFRAWVLDYLEGKGGTHSGTPLQKGGTTAAQLLSVSDSTRLRTLAARLLLTSKPWLRRVQHYRQRGLTVAEIAKLLDRNKATIRKALRDLETLGLVEPPADLPQRQLAAAHLRRSA
jgi:hypothetical protein